MFVGVLIAAASARALMRLRPEKSALGQYAAWGLGLSIVALCSIASAAARLDLTMLRWIGVGVGGRDSARVLMVLGYLVLVPVGTTCFALWWAKNADAAYLAGKLGVAFVVLLSCLCLCVL